MAFYVVIITTDNHRIIGGHYLTREAAETAVTEILKTVNPIIQRIEIEDRLPGS